MNVQITNRIVRKQSKHYCIKKYIIIRLILKRVSSALLSLHRPAQHWCSHLNRLFLLGSISLSFLLEVCLNTTLLCLAVSAHLVVVFLALVIAHHVGHRAANNALSTARHATSKIVELALGLLLLALEVLLATGILERLSFTSSVSGLFLYIKSKSRQLHTSLPIRPPMASLAEPMV